MTQTILERPKASLIDLTDPEVKADAYRLYAYLRAEQPIYRARMGQMRGWLVTRYDDVLALLKDPRFVKNLRTTAGADQLSGRPWIPPFLRAMEANMLDQDDPAHARLRKLVHKAFTPRRIDELLPRIQTIADELLDAQVGKGSMELIRDFALPLPLIVIAELLGIPAADRDRFHKWSTQMMRSPTTFNMLRAIMPITALLRYLRVLFAQRRIEPRDDLITALTQAEEQGDQLSEDEMVAMAILLLIAGHETTVNLIGSGTHALLQNPDQLALLRSQPELLPSAIEELLRYVNPVETATERYAREDLTLLGQPIRRGEMVLAVLASANRDEHQFAHPDVLDITREKNRHLGFGFGIHFCLGAPLARMEAQIALGTLLRRLPELRLAVPESSLRWRSTVIVRSLAKLPVAF